MENWKYCLLTNDVETTSLRNNTLSHNAGSLVLNQGLPRLLDLYLKFNIKSTFFFTGEIIQKFPGVVKMVVPFGHEVACHGYSHDVNEAFDILTLEEQIEHLSKTKKMLEAISGKEVTSFRAPALRVNSDTPLALLEAGFKIDSSIASQRFDLFLSYGSQKKFDRLFAPRLPYYTDPHNLSKKGNGKIFEIPISALLFPYIGTTLRIFPKTTSLFRKLLDYENSINGKPINFLTHPNEFIDEKRTSQKIKRRSKNIVSSLLADKIRYYLKLKNLGAAALPLYEREIQYFSQRGFKFVTVQEFKYKFDLANKSK